jgi:predicted outer membrane repeat protein
MATLVLTLVLVSLYLTPAQARVFPCTAGDTGCIIAAIAKSNLNPDQADVIELDASTFTFERQDNGDQVRGFTATPVIVGTLTIRGASSSQTILERDETPDTPLFRLLHVGAGGTLRFEGLTVQGGAVSPVFFNRGGGILNEGTLVARDFVVTRCEAWIGGGIHTARPATQRLTNCAITENTGDITAGGVAFAGATEMDGCLIADNLAESGAGFAYDPAAGKIVIRNSIIAGNLAFLIQGGGAEGVGELEIVNTVFLDNSSGLRGGAISHDNGQITLRQVAMVGNQAANFGGGIYVIQGTVDIRRSLLANNRVVLGGAGGGIFNSAGVVTLRGSVLAGNEAPASPDCAGTLQVQGRTLIGDTSGCDVQSD